MTEPYFARSRDQILRPDQIGSMSGLAFLQGIRDGRLPGPPIARTLNFRLVEVEEGRVVFRGEPTFDAMNPIGAVHGGWFGTILDSCMACAFQSTLPRGKGYTTLEYKVNIVRPLLADGTAVLATGLVEHGGRRTGVATGTLRGAEDGKLYATGSTTCIVIDLPGGEGGTVAG